MYDMLCLYSYLAKVNESASFDIAYKTCELVGKYSQNTDELAKFASYNTIYIQFPPQEAIRAREILFTAEPLQF